MRLAALVLAWSLSLAGGTAGACEGSKVLYSDDFSTAKLDPSWGTFGDELTIEKGRLVIRPQPAMVYWQTNDLATYTDVDFCVDVTIVDSVAPDEVLAGLIFWYVDDDNLYALQVDASGHASIWRRSRGDWREVAPWGETDLVPTGDGKTNHLRVLVRGKTATTYINGTKFQEISADDLPAGGSASVGIIAGSAGTAVSTVAFDGFKVTAPN